MGILDGFTVLDCAIAMAVRFRGISLTDASLQNPLRSESGEY